MFYVTVISDGKKKIIYIYFVNILQFDLQMIKSMLTRVLKLGNA